MAELSPLHRQALEYIRNAGGAPEVDWFDDDHEPIGPNLRDDLRAKGLIEERTDGVTFGEHVYLTPAGEAEIKPAR